MTSNGQHSALASSMATSESITAAMEAINTLAVWLEDAGLDQSAIAHSNTMPGPRNSPTYQATSCTRLLWEF
jgi:hypothetical protein